MKNYKLSEENKRIEIKHKKDIENNTIRRDRIFDKIRKLKTESQLTVDERRYQILNAEIELEELIMQIDKSNNSISELYAKQAQSNINKKELDSTTQRTKDDLRSYIDLNNYMNEKDMLYSDIEILEKKISLEYLKKNRGEIDEEIFKKNIEEFKDKINNNKETIDYYEMDIKEANYKHKWFDIKNDFNEGKITHKEYKEKEKELEERKDDIKAPSRKEINSIFERVEEKTLEVEIEPEKEEKSSEKEFGNELDVYGILNHEPRKSVDKKVEYKFIDENNKDEKKKYEENIEKYNEEISGIDEKIKELRFNLSISPKERQKQKLELEISKKGIESKIISLQNAMFDLFIKEVDKKLADKRLNNEITSKEYYAEKQKLKYLKPAKEYTNNVKYTEIENIIIDFKTKLEQLKFDTKLTTFEQKEFNIKELEKNKELNKKELEYQKEDIQKEKYDYEYHKIYQERDEIGEKKLKEKLDELENSDINPPTEKEVDDMYNDLGYKYLGKEMSERANHKVAEAWKIWEKQDINEQHETMYKNYDELDNKIWMYSFDNDFGDEEMKAYTGKRLGEDYGKHLDGEKKELAAKFAELEVFGRYRDINNPKLLLQLEKVDGLNIETLEETIGLDTKDLKREIYIATYEEYIDENKGIMSPAKEYYTKGEKGEYIKIGESDKEETTITVDGFDFKLKNDEILKGEELEKVTQKEMVEELIKNEVEKSLGDGKRVTGISKVVDLNFLRELEKQCGYDKKEESLWDRVSIISTINEKGEEDFQILERYLDEDGNIIYKDLEGISTLEKSNRDIAIDTEKIIFGKYKKVESTKTLKEYQTESGDRYAITRDEDGNLGFSEIYSEIHRDDYHTMRSKEIDTYSFETKWLKEGYDEFDIDQSDIENAKEIFNRSKDEMEKTQENTKEDKGREL